jgi:hypothetical protein
MVNDFCFILKSVWSNGTLLMRFSGGPNAEGIWVRLDEHAHSSMDATDAPVSRLGGLGGTL